MPLPVDIDVGDANATPATRIQPPAGGQLRVVQPAGRPAQRAAEDAWLAPHRVGVQEIAQPTKPLRALRRNELNFGSWLLGLVSLWCLAVGAIVMLVGDRVSVLGLVQFGAWTCAAGVFGLVLLILRSDRS